MNSRYYIYLKLIVQCLNPCFRGLSHELEDIHNFVMNHLCLNPCFRGLSHELGIMVFNRMTYTSVLILVFVDFLMNSSKTRTPEKGACLNPCFRGLSHEYTSV